MIYRRLQIGHWVGDFYFAPDGYDSAFLLRKLRSMGAPEKILRRAARKMWKEEPNEGFTWTNSKELRSLVVVGPSSSGAEFIDSFVHEIGHLADAIASHLGVRLDSEASKYVLGDMARSLAGVVCDLGCSDCGK